MNDEIKNQPSCEDELSIGLLSVTEAQKKIIDSIKPIIESETILLREALGRVLSDDVHSKVDVPAHNNSAMDGYAINSSDFPFEGTSVLKVVGIAYAGKPFLGDIKQGESIRIMTGAVLPDACDSVIMQELVECNEDQLRIGTGKKGQNARNAGEDLKQGGLVLSKGRLITAADLGLLGSVGLESVSVVRKLRVAFFSTGDELRSVGEDLELGQIYDSNRYTLFGMLQRLGLEIIDLGVVRDTREATIAAFQKGSEMADVLITTGGVSVGDADYVTETLDKLGQTSFWKIAMKPGRPLAFGNVGGAVFFGLPGNPVSVMVTFAQFVAPALFKLSGAPDQPLPFTFKARLEGTVRKRPGRMEFQRANLQQSTKGELIVSSVGKQGSGILRSMSESNCFIVLDVDETSVDNGEWVKVQPFPFYL